MYPTIQDKVHSEIAQIFPSKHSPINPDDLKQLVYLEMVIKETLRLCPVAPNIAREALQDVLVDGTVVPKGTIMLMSFYALHRRIDIWGDSAEEFDPENFDQDRAKSRHSFGYLPFSGGSRNCIGMKLDKKMKPPSDEPTLRRLAVRDDERQDHAGTSGARVQA